MPCQPSRARAQTYSTIQDCMRPLVAIILKLEPIDDARRHQYGGGKPRKEIDQPSLAGAVPHGIAPRRGRQQGACSSTLCGRIGFKPGWASTLDKRGWSSSGPTEVWLHGHDLGGKAREITRAKKLYGLARYHSRIGSVASMRGMKCRHLSRRRLASWDLGKVRFTPAPVFSRLRSS